MRMHNNTHRDRRWIRHTALALCLATAAGTALADARTQAKRMHDRIAGVPPTEAVLAQMATLIQDLNPVGAAYIAMQNPNFYNVTLKNWVTPWTNEEQTIFAPLNDYTATVIGLIRDQETGSHRPFTDILSANILYIGNSGTPSAANNTYYEQLESSGANLAAVLQPTTQTAVYGLPDAATAGIITTRAAGQAYFVAGTNRAMFRFTSMNFLCRDLEQLKDVTRTPDRIRQDVTRSPGGDSRIFANTCLGCHAGMDGLAGAFAYYNYNEDTGLVEYTPGTVHPKHLINAGNFEFGYVTTDDSWVNYWRNGPNSLLGWDNDGAGRSDRGNGAKSLGEELAHTDAFATCQVEKAFKVSCLRAPSNEDDRNEVQRVAQVFKDNNYSMKRVFAETAAYCRGD